jgi:enolase
MAKIERLSAMEILDSRGRPTVSAACRFASGVGAAASVPSGASTGSGEALELRDGDPSRYGGVGCRRAVENINREINDALRGKDFTSQQQLDEMMIARDGTPNKSRLGANAILAVSIAFARACAAEQGIPLYQHFADMIEQSPRTLPRLTVNLFSGGKHAGGQVPIQDVLLVPRTAKTIDESLATVYAVYQAAIELIARGFNARPLTADEGGLAPPFPDVDRMFQYAVGAIVLAELKTQNVALAVDVAASHFFRDGRYQLGAESLDSAQMIKRISSWIDSYSIVSVEDGLHEEDWSNWPILREAITDRALVLGDDLLCTNPARIDRAIQLRAANALLLKVNQIGTITEAAHALKLARDAGWSVTISARSGETEDNWLADLAVGWGADQIKVGSITHSERLAKYNRLLEIEQQTGLPLQQWPAPK